MRDFKYWHRLHEKQALEQFSTDRTGLLWLKLKSVIRAKVVDDFIAGANLHVKSTRLNDRFVELFGMLSKSVEESHRALDKFLIRVGGQQTQQIHLKKLSAELYKVQNYFWGGDQNNSLDKFLVSRYVKGISSYDLLMSKFATEINTAVQGYVLNSWYNHWTSILIEQIFRSHRNILPAVGQIRGVDFFINDIPFDLKVTYLPNEFIKERRKANGLPVELTYLKKAARAAGITVKGGAKESETKYALIERMLDSGNAECKRAIEQVRQDTLTILDETRNNPSTLTKWFYERQGEMRFGSENRIFVVLVDSRALAESWKLKRNVDLLTPSITRYLDGFERKSIADLRVTYTFKKNPDTYHSLADIIFVVK